MWLNIRIRKNPKNSTVTPSSARSSWVVWRPVLSIFGREIVAVPVGYVNAKGVDQAIERARAKWPHLTRLRVTPKAEHRTALAKALGESSLPSTAE